MLYETKQQVFDAVVSHLRAQAKPCMDELSCVYRNDSGMKCAIGALIPDEVYGPALEGHNISEIFQTVQMFVPRNNDEELFTTDTVEKFREVTALFSGEAADPGFLRDLQLVHDSDEPMYWESSLRAIGERNGLTLSEHDA